MQRVSTYLISAPLPNQPFSILMHGLTGAVDKVPVEVGNFLLHHRGLNIETNRPPLCNISPIDMDALVSRGYITTLSEEEEQQILEQIAKALHTQDLSSAPPSFLIIPSYTCNLRCPYCFQDHFMHAGKADFAKTLDKEQLKQIFTIIDSFNTPGSVAVALGFIEKSSQLKETRGSSITLFGGEPLSARTATIVPEIINEAKSREIGISAITNGVELDLFEEYLGPRGISSVQITLDGLAEVHDKRRRGPEAAKTFTRIVNNIDFALDKGVLVSLRVNVDKTNESELPGLNDFIKEKGWFAHPLFNAAASVVFDPGSANTISPSNLVQITSSLRGGRGDKISSYEKQAEDTLRRCLASQGYPFARVVNCSAETGMLIFDPLQNVYACWEDVGKINHKIATYNHQGIHFGENASTWLSRFPGAINECLRCPYALIHTSGCGSHARKASGRLNAPACEAFPELFPATLAETYSRFEQDLLTSHSAM